MSVLLLGLDAADASIVARLCERGEMPNLKRLREAGLTGALESPADLFAGGVWPTFYTAQPVAAHGIFHNKLWRAGRMRVDIASDDWIAARPFWETLPDPALRVCIIDVPMVLGEPRPVNGVYLGGWGTHDLISRGSWPPTLWSECVQRFGAPSMPLEHFGRQSPRSLAELPRQLSAATRQLTDVALDLMQREAWDITCIVLSATHRAGHYLWDRSQLEKDSSTSDVPHPELIGIYREVDAAVGRILEHATGDTLVIAFAVHGMGPNPGWSDLLPDLLARLEELTSGTPAKRGLLYRVKGAIPFHWARPLLNRLPLGVNHRLVSLWSSRMFDWSTTRWFPVPMDEAGYIRVSLRGRERNGIVAPGAEYDALCDELTATLLALRDERTGQPLARTVVRAFAESPDTPGRVLLPDLVVPWTGPPAAATTHILSAALPQFRYAVPDTLPSGRAGNHTARAWFTARGPGVAVGEAAHPHSVVDLVPTALRHLGMPAAASMAGVPIDLSATMHDGITG